MKPNAGCEARDIFVRFRDMMLYVLLRWKSILLMGMAVSVLATGIQFWRDTNRYNSIEKAPVAEEPVFEPLDADSLAHVALVQRHQWNYDSLCVYNTTAPMMKIDFQAVPTQQMSYLLTGNRSFAAATLYRESLEDEMLYAELAEQFSTETRPVTAAQLAELVTAELEQDPTEAGDCVFVQIRVIAPSREMCESLTQVVRDAADTVDGLARKIGGSYGRWVFDRYGVVRSETVRDLQLARLNEQEKALEELEKATDDLTAAEEDYLFVSDKEETKEPTWSYPAPRISVMVAILGLVGGLLVMVLVYGVRYLYCGRVMSAVEVEVRHGLPVFGALPGIQKQPLVRRWLRHRLQDKDTAPFLLWHRMALTAKNAGVRSVYLAGDPDRMEGLAQVMEQQGIALQIGSSPLANPDTLAALAQAEALIITADLEVTRHETVAEEQELAAQLGNQTLGVLLVKR